MKAKEFIRKVRKRFLGMKLRHRLLLVYFGAD